MIKTLIIDDEPLARALLESYLRKLPGFAFAGACSNALEAFAILSMQPIDLLLLDISMPEISGMDFLGTLKNPPPVIFTTAHAEYAVESYEYHAIDYLLKPITFNRFMKAIHKLQDAMATPADTGLKAPADNDVLFVRSEGKMVQIDLQQLWFIEGYKNYIRLWMEQEKIIVHSTMKSIEEQFQTNPKFIRISKSYIVNIKFVSEFDGNCLLVRQQALAIGPTYREELKKIFEQYQLL